MLLPCLLFFIALWLIILGTDNSMKDIKVGTYVRNKTTYTCGHVSVITSSYVECKTSGDGFFRTTLDNIEVMSQKPLPQPGSLITRTHTASASSSSNITYTTTPRNKLRQLVVNDAVKLKPDNIQYKEIPSDLIGHIVKRKNTFIWVKFDSIKKKIKTTPSQVLYIPPGDGISRDVLVGASWISNESRVHKIITLQSLVSKIRAGELLELRAIILHNNRVYPGTIPPDENDIQKFKTIMESRKPDEELECT